jgi:hypothetical protein
LSKATFGWLFCWRYIPKPLEDAFFAGDKRALGKAAFGSFGYSKATSVNAASRAFNPVVVYG